jgi:hypothetical protein
MGTAAGTIISGPASASGKAQAAQDQQLAAQPLQAGNSTSAVAYNEDVESARQATGEPVIQVQDPLSFINAALGAVANEQQQQVGQEAAYGYHGCGGHIYWLGSCPGEVAAMAATLGPPCSSIASCALVYGGTLVPIPSLGDISDALDGLLSRIFGAETATSFGTESGQAVFWSGLGRNGASQAAEFAAKSGGTTLEQTAGAAALPAYDSANAASVAAWREASAAFARGASGDVRVLLGNSSADSIWDTVEFPALQANPAVTSITAIDPATGESSLLWGR